VRTALLLASKQDGTIKRIAKSDGRSMIASEISRHGHNVSVRSPILYEVSSSGKGHVYDTVRKSDVRSDLEKYKGGDADIINGDFWGVICSGFSGLSAMMVPIGSQKGIVSKPALSHSECPVGA